MCRARATSYPGALATTCQRGFHAPGVYHWVQPKYVCTIKYGNVTPDGHLRHPVFQGIRPDKAPEDCTWDDQMPALSLP